MSFIIWGTGKRAKNINKYFIGEVEAFINSNMALVGGEYEGLPIISFEDYKRNYRTSQLIIAVYLDEDILAILEKEGIYNTLNSNDCPIEMMDNYYPELIDEIEDILKGDYKKGYFVGNNLLTIWLSKNLNFRGINVTIIDEEKAKLVDCSERDIIFEATGKRDIFIENKIISGEWIDLFHLGRLLPNIYQNKAIEQFRDVHKGERVFIIATGPSLKVEDLDTLMRKKEICISMNKIFYCFDQTQWRPDYYLGEDVNLIRYYGDEIRKVNGVKFLSDSFEYEKEEGEQVYRFHLSVAREHYRFGNGDDLTYGYPCGYSVIFGCIYMAIYMGFKDIYIIGADMNYVGRASDEANHFYGNKDSISANNPSVSLPFHDVAVAKNYEYIAKYARKRNVNIYNATRGGKLEVFERVDFDIL